jgi:hypothetical protein
MIVNIFKLFFILGDLYFIYYFFRKYKINFSIEKKEKNNLSILPKEKKINKEKKEKINLPKIKIL